jgi:hypothetical protein
MAARDTGMDYFVLTLFTAMHESAMHESAMHESARPREEVRPESAHRLGRAGPGSVGAARSTGFSRLRRPAWPARCGR